MTSLNAPARSIFPFLRPQAQTYIRVTTTDADGLASIDWLDGDSMADADADEISTVRLEVFLGREPREGESPVASMQMSGAAWTCLLEHLDFDEFMTDLRPIARDGDFGLEQAVRAQIDLFENSYQHDECGTAWKDQWSCGCNDDCPSCGGEIEPAGSTQLRGLVEADDGFGYLDPDVPANHDLDHDVELSFERPRG